MVNFLLLAHAHVTPNAKAMGKIRLQIYVITDSLQDYGQSRGFN